MNLEQELSKGQSKALKDKIVHHVGDDRERFSQLMQVFLQREYRLAQRAAWPVSYCVEKHPHLATPWVPKLIKLLNRPGIPDAAKRNVVRLFQFIEIPGKYRGQLFTICAEYLQRNTEPIAVKVFSMSVLTNIAEKVPELKRELSIMIEDQLPFASPGFKARARKVLKRIK